ncbi:hypothetical protein [Streptomyces niveus]|uniref:hypothetical protein n=1 Tax=Streptomyces niveus TaxID=193462 RepID=UPI0036D3F662
MTSTKRTLPWFETLTDSVYALGESAREYRRAAQAARLAYESVNPQRVQIHEGRVAVGTGSGGTEPHASSVFDVQKAYGDLMHRLENHYAAAAMAYAQGATWAIRQAFAGATPVMVTVPDGSFLPDVPELGTGRYAGAANLAAARDAASRCLAAGEWAEDASGQDYVSDHEAGQIDDAWVLAMGAPEALYAYGLLAERAVHFALLGPKREHERALAAARRDADAS